MRKYFTILTALVLLISVPVYAAPIQRLFQDAKLPTQQMIEKQSITNPAAAGSTNVLSAHAGATSAATVSVTSFVAQPDVPRNLVITPGGTTADVAECVIVVNGTDFFNDSISESFPFANNTTNSKTGKRAFKTISSIVFPANCEDGGFAATWSVGYGEKIGLKRCLDAPANVLYSSVSTGGTQAYEATRPTVSEGGSTEVSLNTADFNGTMNGANDFEIFFLQNYRCFP